MPGIVLDAGDTTVSRTTSLHSQNLLSSEAIKSRK